MLTNATKQNNWPLNENSQKSDFKFSFGVIEEKAVKNITLWFLCRDFFNDFIMFQVAMRNSYDMGFETIYGYTVESNIKYNKDNLVLLVDMKGYTINPKNLQNSINDWEEKYGSESTVTQLGDLLIIQFPSFWVDHHILFSVYTFFIRMIINIELGIYDYRFKNLHYSDVEVIGYDNTSPIYLRYDFTSLVNDLKGYSWESPDYLDYIKDILYPDGEVCERDEDDEYEYKYRKGIDETMYDLHNNGFVDYLQKNGDAHAI